MQTAVKLVETHIDNIKASSSPAAADQLPSASPTVDAASDSGATAAAPAAAQEADAAAPGTSTSAPGMGLVFKCPLVAAYMVVLSATDDASPCHVTLQHVETPLDMDSFSLIDVVQQLMLVLAILSIPIRTLGTSVLL